MLRALSALLNLLLLPAGRPMTTPGSGAVLGQWARPQWVRNVGSRTCHGTFSGPAHHTAVAMRGARRVATFGSEAIRGDVHGCNCTGGCCCVDGSCCRPRGVAAVVRVGAVGRNTAEQLRMRVVWALHLRLWRGCVLGGVIWLHAIHLSHELRAGGCLRVKRRRAPCLCRLSAGTVWFLCIPRRFRSC